ncbi:uncharacterized protein B0H18DRAFT_68135 [Fomitopsis serialis]|uniref:uncharacterized protein n=1 Tax=Fomitopsis serialis TaxID=139415 RepID=UPI002008B2EF|nr:uncharacterized protein B0H18DRAFT_68135 [Neoantrodia serialis]KAH9931819.1 hypothetical protein B0H18DRAFT_68135 [Neoantrodia serialis]
MARRLLTSVDPVQHTHYGFTYFRMKTLRSSSPTQRSESCASDSRSDTDSDHVDQDTAPNAGPSPRPGDSQSLVLSQAVPNRIPLEVYEETINWMDSSGALACAALVCAAWYPRAARNIYFSIHINTRASFDLLVKQLLTSPRVKRWLSTTRELFASDNEYVNLRRQGKTRRDFVHALPLVFGRALSGLRTLEMRTDLLPATPPTFFVALTQLKTLKSLSLRNLTLSSVAQLRWIVSSFTGLKELTLYNCSLRHPASLAQAGVIIPQLGPMLLRRLEVDVANVIERFESMADWLAYSATCVSLHELKVWWPANASLSDSVEVTARSVDGLLRAAGSSLRRFCEVSDYAIGRVSHGNLMHNRNLRYLECGTSGMQGGDMLAALKAMVGELHNVFSTIRSHQVEHIKLGPRLPVNVGLPVPHGELGPLLERLELQDLHAVMSQPFFDGLQAVEFVLPAYSQRGEEAVSRARRSIRELAPVVRGILRPWEACGVLTLHTTLFCDPSDIVEDLV